MFEGIDIKFGRKIKNKSKKLEGNLGLPFPRNRLSIFCISAFYPINFFP